MSIFTNAHGHRDTILSATDQSLIADFLANKQVMVFQPASGSGNEACRATNELVARKRREFRQNRRNAAKAAAQ